MIPKTNHILTAGLAVEPQPTRSYQMEGEHIHSHCDGLAAMKQVVYKIIHTERYQSLIYSWSYGTELGDLIGQPMEYVAPEIERRLTEALTQDVRISNVSDFVFTKGDRGKLQVSFVVHTQFGQISAERTV